MKKKLKIFCRGYPQKNFNQKDPFGAFWYILVNYENGDQETRRPKKRKSVKKLKTLMPELSSVCKPCCTCETSHPGNLVDWSPRPAPSHYLNQCWNIWNIVNCALRDKLQLNLNKNLHIFIKENAFENVVWEMLAILSRPQCVK